MKTYFRKWMILLGLMTLSPLSFSQQTEQVCDLNSFSRAEHLEEVKCVPETAFKPVGHLIGAQKVSFYDESWEYFTYLQLVLEPDAQGKSHYLNILVENEYGDDAQIQGSGTGGYHIDGDLLYSYIYWEKGAEQTHPYGIERITYQWKPQTANYEIVDYVYSFHSGYNARGWDTPEKFWTHSLNENMPDKEAMFLKLYDLESLSDPGYNKPYFAGLATQDLNNFIDKLTVPELYSRFVWGEETQKLLIEAQARIGENIRDTLKKRQFRFCFQMAGTEEGCDEFR